MTGIGGQGIQLATSVLAAAAVSEGLQVQLFGSYGGMMRGGPTAATVVMGNQPIEAPPTPSVVWSAIFMHHEHADGAWDRLGEGGLALVNTTVIERDPARSAQIVGLAATDLAIDVGNAMTASMVMMGAYATVTEVVSIDALLAAVEDCLPSYRRQHIELNRRAIEVGAAAAPSQRVPAWPQGALR